MVRARLARLVLCGVVALPAALFCVLPCASAQNPPTQKPASPPVDPGEKEFIRQVTVAQRALFEQRWEDAKKGFEAILALAQQQKNELWEARGISGIGAVAYSTAHYPEAREKLVQSLATFEKLDSKTDIGRVCSMLGNVAYYMGALGEARKYYEESIAAYQAAGDTRMRARVVFNMLRFASDGSNDDAALLQKLLEEARAAGDKVFEGDILHSWGDSLLNSGDYEGAFEKLNQAAPLFQAAGARESLATLYNSLGRLYRLHGQLKSALQYQLESLEIQRALNYPSSVVQSLNAVAVTYESLDERAQAKKYFEEALSLAEKTGSQRLVDFIRGNLASLLMESGEFERSRAMLEQVITNGLDTHTSARYLELSAAYRKLGRFQDALEAARKALDSCAKQDQRDCASAYVLQAYAELALGNDARALADETTALATLEKMHAKLAESDFLKQEFHHNWERTYSLAIELHFQHGEFKEGLEAAELARSRAFLDLLASRDSRQGRGAQEQASGSPVAPAAAPAGSQAIVLRGGSEGASSSPGASGNSRDLRSESIAAPPTARDVSAIAARLRSTILLYWVADDQVYIWTVAPDGQIHGQRVNVLRSKLGDLVRATVGFTPAQGDARGAQTSRGTESLLSLGSEKPGAWRELYNLLIQPVREWLPRTPGARLTIVPHGLLQRLSFAALQDARGRYLLEDFTLNYVPASAVLQFTATRLRPDARTGKVLLIADPHLPPARAGESPLPQLPGARAEARDIARLLPSASVTLLAGENADETRVRQAATQETVLHFATHAVVKDDDPFNSFLALARPSDGSNDGRLTAQEIYDLRLGADLVVLSACRSGEGRITGDGIATLGRAFFYAGTPSLVVSLWDVADEPTNRLLPAFYRAWLHGSDKGAALRSAQLQLLRDLRARKVKLSTPAGEVILAEQPAFWAGFLLLGELD